MNSVKIGLLQSKNYLNFSKKRQERYEKFLFIEFDQHNSYIHKRFISLVYDRSIKYENKMPELALIECMICCDRLYF